MLPQICPEEVCFLYLLTADQSICRHRQSYSSQRAYVMQQAPLPVKGYQQEQASLRKTIHTSAVQQTFANHSHRGQGEILCTLGTKTNSLSWIRGRCAFAQSKSQYACCKFVFFTHLASKLS